MAEELYILCGWWCIMLIFEKMLYFQEKKLYFWSKTKNAYTIFTRWVIYYIIKAINLGHQQPFESLRVMTLGDVDRHWERFKAVERGSETYLTHSATATAYVTGHDWSLTSKMTGWGAVRTSHDRSHTIKMTGWGAVCDRSGGRSAYSSNWK